MKKFLKNFFIVLAVIVLIAVVWVIDNTRVIEKASDEIVALAKENKDKNTLAVAYSITETSDKIVFTIYSDEEAITTTLVFNLEDSKVVSTSYERHYETKLQAKLDTEDIKNKEVKGNVVKGITDTVSIGKDAQTVINELEETYSKILVRI